MPLDLSQPVAAPVLLAFLLGACGGSETGVSGSNEQHRAPAVLEPDPQPDSGEPLLRHEIELVCANANGLVREAPVSRIPAGARLCPLARYAKGIRGVQSLQGEEILGLGLRCEAS